MVKKALIMMIALLFFLCRPDIAMAQAAIIINKATNQLHYLQNGEVVRTFPVATGRHPSYTPEGNFTVVVKLVNPYYSKLAIPGGSPANPLGVRWLGLSIGGGGIYGIHGTNNPASIGTYASAGCIRMHNRDVIWLYGQTPLGTPVTITGRWAPAAQIPKPRAIKVIAGEQQITVQPPPGSNGQPLLPLRVLFELLEYSVTWDGATSTVHAAREPETVAVNFTTGRITAGDIIFNEPGINIISGTAYGPLPIWSRMLPNMEVRWDPAAGTVTITGAKPPVHPH